MIEKQTQLKNIQNNTQVLHMVSKIFAPTVACLSLYLSLSLNGKFDLGTGEAGRGKFFFSAFISIKLCLLLSISNVSINERRE